MREVCEAGLDALVHRTTSWLNLAVDYSLQTLDGNAGVIVQQLCTERRFMSLTCLGLASAAANHCVDDPNWHSTVGETFTCTTYTASGRNHNYCDSDVDGTNVLAEVACPAACGSCTPQSSASPAAVLSDQHDQACMLAVSIGLGPIGEGRASRTMDVPPITFAGILDTNDNLVSFIDGLIQNRGRLIEADLHRTLVLEIARRSTDTADSEGFMQGQIEASMGRMRQFGTQFSHMDGTIQRRLQPKEINGSPLLNAVALAIGASKHNFVQLQGAVGNGDELVQSAAQSNGPTCDSTCAVLAPPPSSGCSDRFQSWAAAAALWLTGCIAAPQWGGAASCCEDHDVCYNTCGMTQAYCDQQLQNCVEAKISMPECHTAIDTTGLVVGLPSCSAFEAAQDVSVLRRCHSTAPVAHPGCVAPAPDRLASLAAAEHVVATVHAVAGAVMADPIDPTACTSAVLGPGINTPIPQGCAHALGEITAIAASSSDALRAVEGTLLQDEMFRVLSPAPPISTVPIGSGHRILAEDDCDTACQERIAALGKSLQVGKRLVASLPSLSVFNSQLVDGGAGGPISAAKLDLQEVSFGARSQQVLVDSLRTLGGGSGAVEMEQVSLLIQNKVLHGLSYHQASLSKQSNEVQRELLGRRAAQALQTIAGLTDSAAQLAVGQEYFDVKVRFHCHLALQNLHQAARAYEYLFLTDYTGLDFRRLESTRLTGPEYKAAIAQEQINLRTAFTNAAARFNNAGESVFAGTAFALADLPVA